ncbi:GNAT family N-acetyltransferase [Streptomyces meridianus]|uniref:GNAT family N-acetyltransferase n=1 Tax=Streptomyces meridianus TaxID=2938945 RepID=A0ABT0X2G3_9ACTN|nr:GNAT family N-acetyltransferase [Streptomyces meridianus]MCM2576644.1 GNAT family N-acetyltransferase [Streptomyces meridianus]
MPGRSDSADLIAAQVADPVFPVWVLVENEGRVVGFTTLFEEAPTLGWSAAERREPAFYLSSSFTDPSYHLYRLGRMMAWWAVDRAAQQGRDWVRRVCTDAGLVRRYTLQGFHLVREVGRGGDRLRLMARSAELLPELEEMMGGR